MACHPTHVCPKFATSEPLSQTLGATRLQKIRKHLSGSMVLRQLRIHA
ncbi:hypothetical protein QDY72_00905 [Kingella negevensis]|nr:hypothetical protein [Kingella negevensis]MDK4679230.1 hypothetical protein [Kingella negevensis]MDK4683048.1 hypothetical protein [Kingella negevensis]MDK4683763.1 hypothetical protein [Kingella negevensis]MDK4691248.1 hypothetical protein [Kingella negevensis]MDK4693604.1 hypothetical protein [Kingella negevensis]